MAASAIFDFQKFQILTLGPQYGANMRHPAEFSQNRSNITTIWGIVCHAKANTSHDLFCSIAVLDPKVGHTMDALSPFMHVLCHSDWLFHGESVRVLMLSIQAVRGFPRLREHGIVPCIISISRQIPCFILVCSSYARFLVLTVSDSSFFTLC